MQKPIISADSHITEPPGTYVDRCDRKFRDRAPHMVRDPKMGDMFVIDGMERPMPMGLLAAAGKAGQGAGGQRGKVRGHASRRMGSGCANGGPGA